MSGEIARGFFLNDEGKLDHMQVGSKGSTTGGFSMEEAQIVAQMEIAAALRDIASGIANLALAVEAKD